MSRRLAGVEKEAFYNLHPRTEDIELKVLNWVTENVGEMGFRDWETFEHPQLGTVEIGGLVDIWVYRNPPPKLLENLCHKNMLFNLRHAAAAPRVLLDDVNVEALGADLYKIRAVVSNHGYLPTNLSDVAMENKEAVPVRVGLELNGADLIMNPAEVDVGHLAGRNERKYPWSPWGQGWSAVSKAIEWLVRVKDVDSARIEVQAVSQKGGTHAVEVELKGSMNAGIQSWQAH